MRNLRRATVAAQRFRSCATWPAGRNKWPPTQSSPAWPLVHEPPRAAQARSLWAGRPATMARNGLQFQISPFAAGRNVAAARRAERHLSAPFGCIISRPAVGCKKLAPSPRAASGQRIANQTRGPENSPRLFRFRSGDATPNVADRNWARPSSVLWWSAGPGRPAPRRTIQRNRFALFPSRWPLLGLQI